MISTKNITQLNKTINNKRVIPLNLFQTWSTKEIPPKMKTTITNLQKANQEFKYYLYDDEQRRNFIKEYFNYALESYDTLIPNGYRSDLFRLCVLYKYGGIYLDVKFKCVNGFKFIYLTDKEYYVKDIEYEAPSIYNALIVSKPNNIFLLKCIDQIIKNVKNRFYGKSSLQPTGPWLMGQIYEEMKYVLPKIELYHNASKKNIAVGSYDGKSILEFYDGYREEQQKYQTKEHYHTLWMKRNIYIN